MSTCKSIGRDVELIGKAIQRKCDEWDGYEGDNDSRLKVWHEIQGDYYTLQQKVNQGRQAEAMGTGQFTGETEEEVGEVTDEPYVCGGCGGSVYLGDHHCAQCGEPLNWNHMGK